jgi:DNA ligase (NAD+)
MAKVTTLEEVLTTCMAWGMKQVHVSPKYDGLACEAIYENGVLTELSTRGDGQTGESIFHHARLIPELPPFLKTRDRLTVRGEIVLYRKDLTRYNEHRAAEGKNAVVSTRNAASGAVRASTVNPFLKGRLHFIPYQVVDIDHLKFQSHSDALADLAQEGLCEQGRRIAVEEITEAFLKDWGRERNELPFDIDGLVFHVDDLALTSSLGASRHSPRWAVAYKFPAQEQQTRLTDIIIQVGRSGKITPVAIFEPVLIGDVMCSRASLHNVERVLQLGMAIGDTILVKRSGDVIPQVSGVLEHRHQNPVWEFPKTCACGEPLTRVPGEVSHFCLNPQCPAQVVRKLCHFVSKQGLDIKGMGTSLIATLVNGKFVDSYAGLLDLNVETFRAAGVGPKRSKLIFEELQHAKTVPVKRLVMALGLRGLQEAGVERILERFTTWDALRHASSKDLESIDRVPEFSARCLHKWLTHPPAWLERLTILD